MIIQEDCPRCGSTRHKKNGPIHNGKQNHRCKACGRQFVGAFEQRRVSAEHRALIERLLKERLSLRGICRAVGVGMKWRMAFQSRVLSGGARPSERADVGDRSQKSARLLWNKLPAAYRQHATFYTDAYAPYRRVIPQAQHRVITKAAR